MAWIIEYETADNVTEVAPGAYETRMDAEDAAEEWEQRVLRWGDAKRVIRRTELGE